MIFIFSDTAARLSERPPGTGELMRDAAEGEGWKMVYHGAMNEGIRRGGGLRGGVGAAQGKGLRQIRRERMGRV